MKRCEFIVIGGAAAVSFRSSGAAKRALFAPFTPTRLLNKDRNVRFTPESGHVRCS
jgi:hypothetical protein